MAKNGNQTGEIEKSTSTFGATHGAIQKAPNNPLAIAAQFVTANRDKLATYLPPGVNQEKFLTSVFLAFDDSETLREALRTPTGQSSVLSALRLAACKGLSLNPQEGLAGFVPYRGKITYRIFAAGLIELAIRDGHIKEARSRVVYANDTLELGEDNTGDTYRLARAVDNPGEIRGFLAVARIHDGTIRTHYMSVEQVEAWGERYGMRNKDGKLSPMWRESFEGAGQKTVIRQLLTKLHIAIPGLDEEEEEYAASYVVEAQDAPRLRTKGTAPEDVQAALEQRQAARDANPPGDPDDGEPVPGDQGTDDHGSTDHGASNDATDEEPF